MLRATTTIVHALAAGCTFIVKPAGQTPLSALAMAELAARAGVPPGVFNVVTGSSREIGAELTGSPVVRKLSFTGSTEVGRVLIAQCAPTLKKLSMAGEEAEILTNYLHDQMQEIREHVEVRHRKPALPVHETAHCRFGQFERLADAIA